MPKLAPGFHALHLFYWTEEEEWAKPLTSPDLPTEIGKHYSIAWSAKGFSPETLTPNGYTKLHRAMAGQDCFRVVRTVDFSKPEVRYVFGRDLWTLTPQELALTWDELRFEFLEVIDKRRQRHEKLKDKFEGVAGQATLVRPTISRAVKMFVWRRDEGRCTTCGSQESLEYDHIIPLHMGGSTTERNLQLLCEKYHLLKGTDL